MSRFSALRADAAQGILIADTVPRTPWWYMPRYYFDVRDSTGFHRDEIGDVFNDFEEARTQAQSILPDIAREELPDGELHSITCDVRDDTGRIVYRGRLTYEGTRDPV